jgi:hypothetical protein
LIQDDVEDPHIISALVALFRRDLSASRQIADKIGVKASDFTPIMAAAVGKLDLLSEYYPELKRLFGISNTRAVETICQIAHGQT